jgi:hypothetical protein
VGENGSQIGDEPLITFSQEFDLGTIYGTAVASEPQYVGARTNALRFGSLCSVRSVAITIKKFWTLGRDPTANPFAEDENVLVALDASPLSKDLSAHAYS